MQDLQPFQPLLIMMTDMGLQSRPHSGHNLFQLPHLPGIYHACDLLVSIKAGEAASHTSETGSENIWQSLPALINGRHSINTGTQCSLLRNMRVNHKQNDRPSTNM
jgi:hypothetical protein